MSTDELLWYTARAERPGGVGAAQRRRAVGARAEHEGARAPAPAELDAGPAPVPRGRRPSRSSGVHVGRRSFVDGYTSFGPVEVLVPLTSAWNPTAVAWGIVAMYLLLAVELTSLVRRRLSKRTWHLVHLLSLPLVVISTVHLLTAGTDSGNPVLTGAVLLTAAAIGALTGYRFLGGAAGGAPTRTPQSAVRASRSMPSAPTGWLDGPPVAPLDRPPTTPSHWPPPPPSGAPTPVRAARTSSAVRH